MKVVFAILVPLGAFAGLAWIGGYDFDHRGPSVLFFTACAILGAVLFADYVTD